MQLTYFLVYSMVLPSENLAHFDLSDKLPTARGGDVSRLIDRVAKDPYIKTLIVNAFWTLA